MDPKSEEDDSAGGSSFFQWFTNPFNIFGTPAPPAPATGQRMKQVKAKPRRVRAPPLKPAQRKKVTFSAPVPKKQPANRTQTGPPTAAVGGVRRSTRKRQAPPMDPATSSAPPSKKASTSRSKTTAKVASKTRTTTARSTRSTAAKKAPANPGPRPKVGKKATAVSKSKGKFQSKGKPTTKASKKPQQLVKTTRRKKMGKQ